MQIEKKIKDLIKKSDTSWNTPEWGFPKGRRNFKEPELKEFLKYIFLF